MAPTATNINDDSPKAAAKIAKSVAAGLEAPADATRELPFAFTTFAAPPPLNAKNAGSSYLKAEKQAWSVRNPSAPVLEKDQRTAARVNKRRRKQEQNGIMELDDDPSDEDDDMDEDEDEVTHNNTIVVHLGSSELRIGLATDLNPLTLPNCLARRDALTTAKRKLEAAEAEAERTDASTETRINNTIEALRADLRSIMRNLKLRGVANGKQQAANYNASVVPETLDEHQDIFAVEWTEAKDIKGDIVIGEDAEKLPYFSGQPAQKGEDPTWKLFYPIKVGHFNFEEYAGHYGESSARAAILSDIQIILSDAITSAREAEPTKDQPEQNGGHGLGVPKEDWKHFNIALIVPDLYMSSEVDALVELLLTDMGFAGVMLQQESVCATFGAGQSSACVVHAGSSRISITCVDEGLVLADSRQLLGYGGLQCSQLFTKLLQQANFPYKDFNANMRLADRWLADELKERLCTLDPFQLSLVISDFHVRLPDKRAQKFQLRTYDEVIVGAMGFFNPKAFASQTIPERFLLSAKGDLVGDDDADDVTEKGFLPHTQAMQLNVPHLLPPPPTAAQTTEAKAVAASASKQVSPAPPASGPSTAPGLASSPPLQPVKTDGVSNGADATPSLGATPVAEEATAASARASPVAERVAGGVESSAVPPGPPQVENPPASTDPAVNIAYEASRTHLDFAVWNSIVAGASGMNTPAASEERIKRMATNILCTGGSALLPGLGMAIEARLNNYISALWTSQGKDVNAAPNAVAVPPPRDMDPRIVPWKGMAVLTRLDNHVSDLWLLRQEWQLFGMRALRERTYFMS